SGPAPVAGAPATIGEAPVVGFSADFRAALDDDLNVSGALAAVHERVREGNTALDEGEDDEAVRAARDVIAMTEVLGVNPVDPRWSGGGSAHSPARLALAALVRAQLGTRQAARTARDYASADAVRDQLAAAGIAIEDTPTGARWSLVREL
ncbi:MAG TPA: DALR domain-containing protein, partial [Candidatus Lustribacter sp.]|nr:DALR domain-containing protein [Candidatus Lustribacter sp.]